MDGPLPGRVLVDPDDPTRLLMDGEVDLFVVERARLQAQDLAQVRTIDARAVTFMDSMGLHCMVAIAQERWKLGQKAILVEPTNMVIRLLEMTGLITMFDVVSRRARHS